MKISLERLKSTDAVEGYSKRFSDFQKYNVTLKLFQSHLIDVPAEISA